MIRIKEQYHKKDPGSLILECLFFLRCLSGRNDTFAGKDFTSTLDVSNFVSCGHSWWDLRDPWRGLRCPTQQQPHFSCAKTPGWLIYVGDSVPFVSFCWDHAIAPEIPRHESTAVIS